MLIQTRRAIDGLKAAGFDRSEFRVRTPLNRTTGEYKPTEIYLHADNNKQLAHVLFLLEQDFDVTVYAIDGFTTIDVKLGNGQLSTHNFVDNISVTTAWNGRKWSYNPRTMETVEVA